MTISAARLAANRANARRSTGPRTPEGKAATSRNALQHGAYATDATILAAPNSPAPALVAAFTAEYAPSGPAETVLVQRLAILTARMDLLARAFDALPALYQSEAREAYLAAQAGPATDPNLAAYTLVYALTSPRAALLLRQDTAADRRFMACLRELQRLQAEARPTQARQQEQTQSAVVSPAMAARAIHTHFAPPAAAITGDVAQTQTALHATSTANDREQTHSTQHGGPCDDIAEQSHPRTGSGSLTCPSHKPQPAPLTQRRAAASVLSTPVAPGSAGAIQPDNKNKPKRPVFAYSSVLPPHPAAGIHWRPPQVWPVGAP